MTWIKSRLWRCSQRTVGESLPNRSGGKEKKWAFYVLQNGKGGEEERRTFVPPLEAAGGIHTATGQPGKKSSLTDLGIPKLPTYEGTLQFLV